MKKEDFFTVLKIAGTVFAVPFVLFAGPFVGYLIADFLRNRFNAPFYVYYILCGIGLGSGIFETIQIIGLALKQQSKQD
jgi:hypothetical protein